MYDAIIIGAGPAGLAAAIYAVRYNLKTLVIYHELGGAINNAHLIENYPGFKRISGTELIKKFNEQATSLGAKLKQGEVIDIKKGKGNFKITLKNSKEKLEAKTIILALGTKRKKLNIKGEDKYIGKGVSYCATCDGPFYKNKTAAVMGGGNSAINAVEILSEIAKKVYLIHRRKEFRADPQRVDNAKKFKNVEIIIPAQIKEIKGDKIVRSVLLDTGKELELDGVFVECGGIPSASIAKLLKVKLDQKGYIITSQEQETNVKGIFAAGDVTNTKLKQLTTAVGQGALAAFSAYSYIKN